jgi:hypothetical protein
LILLILKRLNRNRFKGGFVFFAMMDRPPVGDLNGSHAKPCDPEEYSRLLSGKSEFFIVFMVSMTIEGIHRRTSNYGL